MDYKNTIQTKQDDDVSPASKVFKVLKEGPLEIKLVMVGLDRAGNTTLLYALKLGEIVTTIPTIGFNVETLDYKDTHITMWDVGGQDKIRQLWKHYIPEMAGFIYCVDSTDKERLEESRAELEDFLKYDGFTKNEFVLILSMKNGSDKESLSLFEMSEKLNLDELLKDRKWTIKEIGSLDSMKDPNFFNECYEWINETVREIK